MKHNLKIVNYDFHKDDFDNNRFFWWVKPIIFDRLLKMSNLSYKMETKADDRISSNQQSWMLLLNKTEQFYTSCLLWLQRFLQQQPWILRPMVQPPRFKAQLNSTPPRQKEFECGPVLFHCLTGHSQFWRLWLVCNPRIHCIQVYKD